MISLLLSSCASSVRVAAAGEVAKDKEAFEKVGSVFIPLFVTGFWKITHMGTNDTVNI